MIILKSNDKVMASDVVEENGFKDTTPEISTYTHKIFERDGKKYRFVGWHTFNHKRGLWDDIEMEEIP